MTKARAIAVVAVVLLLAGVIGGSRLLRQDEPTEVEAVFSATVGLYPGSDVRVLGVRVGEVRSVVPDGDAVRVRMEIDAGQKVAASTGAVVLAPSLVSDRYVQLTEPWEQGPVLADDAVIPESRTSVPVELDEIYTSLDDLVTALGPDGANRNGALSDLLATGAANLDGNGADLNRVLKEFGDATGTLSSSDEDLFKTVANLDRFNQTLVENDDAVGQVNTQLATVSQYLAEDRQDLAAAIETLGTSLGQVKGFIRDNRGQLRSSVTNLTSTAKLLNRQRRSLAELLQTLPVTLQNFLGAYNPETGVLEGRTDLNELSIWATSVGGQAASGSDSSSSANAQDAPPPLLLPSVGQTTSQRTGESP